ncbi:MAG: glycosyltransferase family 4 protein [Variibacter sp.]|nr:glycosyltransferase family 4 protein [Variibacter sp.]
MASSPPPRLLFIVTEDWFFHSHFLPMARAAKELGCAVGVVTRVRAHGGALEALGLEVLPLDDERSRHGPLQAMRTLAALVRLLRRERPDIIHCIALKPVVLGGFAGRLAGVKTRLYALTGQGFLGAERSAKNRLVLLGLRIALRWLLDGPAARYLFENEDDARAFAPWAGPARITLVGGAGIEPSGFAVAPLPALPPLRVAVVARMLWQKGIDTAVAAVRLARARGVAVELSLYGTPDPHNPRPITTAQLRAWSAEPGVAWHGRTEDVAEVWAAHHVCCLPSRGGEGLPRALLEAAACGRALVTTDVPGCRRLVRDGVEGLLAPPDDPERLAQAFERLAQAPDLLESMGRAARRRISKGFSTEAVVSTVKSLYADMLPARSPPPGR